MNRRKFIGSSGAATAVARLGCGAQPEAGSAPAGARSRMRLGCQRSPTTPEMLDFFRRHGVEGICGYPPISPESGCWTKEGLEQTRDLCAHHGIALDMVALPLLSSSHIDREKQGAILLGQEPQRSRDIERIQKMIEACGRAGIAAFKYNVSLLGVLRIGSSPGRGSSQYSTWKLSEARQEPPRTRAGQVDADLFWERVDHLIQRIIPVCEEYKVRAACHPHDPGVPETGFQGVTQILGTVEGLRRFAGLRDSPYHGLNFCVGTVAEMLQEPNREIFQVIREFGNQGKLFNIHLRNIRGKRDDFQEVYPDEGDLDLVAVLRSLQQTGYSHLVMPDHMPHHAADPQGLQAFAYGYGYIKGALQAVQGRQLPDGP